MGVCDDLDATHRCNSLLCSPRARKNTTQLNQSPQCLKQSEWIYSSGIPCSEIASTVINLPTCLSQERNIYDDFKTSIATTKISITCPNCSTKLGVNVSSSNHAQHLKLGISQKLNPDDSGDKTGYCSSTEAKGIPVLLKPIILDDHRMSYTILKSCTSSPESTAYASDRNTLPGWVSNKYVGDKRTIGKTTISNNFSRRGRNPNLHIVRSRSYTISPAAATHSNEIATDADDNYITVKPIYSPVKMPNPIASTPNFLPFPTSKNIPENLSVVKLLNDESSLTGIDTVEVASLYDSSSATSCGSEVDNNGQDIVKQATDVSHVAPNPHSHASSSHSQSSINSTSSRDSKNTNTSDEAMRPTSANSATKLPGNNAELQKDIPGFRQDLYKDCLTLFLETWFGRRQI